MDFFKILKGGVGVGMSNFDRLFAERYGGRAWQLTTLTGTLPLSFKSKGEALTDYKLHGTAEGAGTIGNNLFIGIIRDCWVNFNGEIVSRENYCVLYALIEEGKTYCFSALMGAIPTPNGYFLSKPKIGDMRSASVDLQYDEMSGYEACHFTSTITGYVAFSQISVGDDYAVRGMVMTEGSTPAPYDFNTDDPPYGYKLPMTMESGEDTGNLINPNEAEQGEGYMPNTILTKEGTLSSPSFYVTEFIPIKPNTTYWLFTNLFRTSKNLAIKFYQDFSTYLSWIGRKGHNSVVDYEQANCDVFTTSSEAHYLRLSVDKESTQNMLIEADAFPPEYIPYRYSAVTPIYIGDSKLMGAEYVDYESGKIYRLIDGVLTPTDPPVDLPELSAYQGENTLSCSEELGEVSITGYIKGV